MYNVAIIGAGQLGSRHLQGLKGAASPLSISVVDSSEESLKVAKERYEAIPAVGEKSANFYDNLQKLPEDLDLVIVATGSKPRAAIVKSLLSVSKVKNLVLEKVLFPKLSDYAEIEKLLDDNGVNCWVNCPRRMFGMYQQIAQMIDKSNPINMISASENWGLCCNGIHIIDIFMYLTGEASYSIDVSKLNTEIENSKRPGYIEMTGTITITTPTGNKLTLISENGFHGEKGKFIQNGSLDIFIDEGKGYWRVNDKEIAYKMPYQSQLSGLLADGVLISGNCALTPYKLSASYHKPFIASLLQAYNKITGENVDLLPIT